jgi:hypothetical protein
MSKTNFRKVAPNIRQDESIYVFVRSSFWVFLPWVALGLILIGVAVTVVTLSFSLFPTLFSDPLAFNILIILVSAFLLMLLAFLTVAFIDYYYDIHIVTDERLIDIDFHGLFSQEISELALEDVQDVTAKKEGILGTIFDFGTVMIETSSETPKFEFDNIPHPREVSTIILDLAALATKRVEQGDQVVVLPRGELKGVIEGRIFNSINDLIKIGAVIPKQAAVAQAATRSESPPKPEAPAKPAPPIEKAPPAAPSKPLERAAAPSPPKPAPKPTSPPTTPPAKPPASSPKPNQPSKPKEVQDDLDIIIDDPNQPRR